MFLSSKLFVAIRLKQQLNNVVPLDFRILIVVKDMRKNYQGAQKTHPPVAPIKRKNWGSIMNKPRNKTKNHKKAKIQPCSTPKNICWKGTTLPISKSIFQRILINIPNPKRTSRRSTFQYHNTLRKKEKENNIYLKNISLRRIEQSEQSIKNSLIKEYEFQPDH